MASDENLKDLQWVLQVLESENCINLQKVSFFLSHQISGCQQETESCININLSKENNALFSYLLTQLSTMTKNSATSALRNLEFHRVIWEVEYLRSLKSLLENNPGVKQIVFQRNDFSLDCLKELSEILKADENVKEIVFCESCIGGRGAGIIADTLKANDCIEELQIWEDSIGLRGAEELSKMIEANTSLKLLIVFDSSLFIATPLISAVLARNRDMEVHIWSAEKGERCSKVVEFVLENSTLRIYRLDISGSCRVVCALGMNTIVKVLDMTGVRLKSKWAREFRWVLEQNRTLKEVKLSKCCLKDKGVVYVSAGLFKNRSLETLHLDGNCFSAVGVEHLLCPLSRFSALQCQANTTLKSLTFGGERMRVGRAGLEAILQMITSNQSLSRLGIVDDQGLRPGDIVRIFQSLEKNASLKYLSLKGCRGVKGESVLQAIVETLQVNPWIEEIDLEDTPLHKAGMAEGIYQKLGQNAKSEPDMDFFKDMPMITPKSCRVFVCGQEYAGKSSLCNSISYNFLSTKLPYVNQVRTLVNPVEQAIKSEGMKISSFKDEDTKIFIWNLAGQQELYSLHDLMFPGHGSASFFLVLLSMFKKPSNKEMKDPAEIEEDLQYWLRFIVSNSRRAVQQCMLPNVTIVLTHFDKVILPSQNFQAIVNLIQGLRDKFNGFLEFYPTVFTVDARSSTSVSKLAQHLKNTSKMILQRVPRVYELCNDLAEILLDWRKDNDNKPAMSWKEFCELCQVKVPPLRVQSRFENKEKTDMRRRAVASCLHQIGEVIYFDDPGFFILDCEWFCQEVLAQLVRLKAARKQGSIRNGFISRKDLEKILKGSFQSQLLGMSSKVFENLEATDLVKLMLKLELCYEQDLNDPNSAIFVPSFLEEGRQKQQKWQLSSSDCVYAGRHLDCDDSSCTFLTPGFFPQLQVNLHNKFMELKDQHGATYSMETSLISININGIDVRVELGGQLSHYIDILACSTKNLTETLRLIHHLIIPAIHGLCQGIVLIENIIRPECVRSLIPPRYRKTQLVALHKLKEALLTVSAEGMYDYQHTWSAVSDTRKPIIRAGFDFARDLLSDDDFLEVIHRRYHDLYNLANELDVPPDDDPDSVAVVTSESVDPSFSGIAKGVEQVLQRLKIIEQEIRDLKQEIQGLRYYEHRLLLELHRKVDHLVNYNAHIEERKVPNMFFFVRTENYSRRLVTTIISGMTAMRLHML
ncbi:protein TORNADO 1-like [Chenopodium quinoa]|uniref:protein TORNADO 1-like n=1 Tax=Chenopodium quinoa TaxID=63459 RepID=UPI000B796995|nr:protein TORNADO 1-like [Chenopodium quinoa]